jgi:hypothetical protein
MQEKGFKNPPYAFYPISPGAELTLACPDPDEAVMKVREVVETSSPPINGKSINSDREAVCQPRQFELVCDIEFPWVV